VGARGTKEEFGRNSNSVQKKRRGRGKKRVPITRKLSRGGILPSGGLREIQIGRGDKGKELKKKYQKVIKPQGGKRG